MTVLTPELRARALGAVAPLRLGRVAELLGLQVRITGLTAAVGDLISVEGRTSVLAEVAASGPGGLTCCPRQHTGLQVGDVDRTRAGPAGGRR